MDDQKKNAQKQDVKSLNKWACISGAGFLLYLGAAAMEWILVKDLIAIVFGGIAIFTFSFVADARKKDKEAVSYNLLWGTGSLAIMLGACAILGIKLRLGL